MRVQHKVDCPCIDCLAQHPVFSFLPEEELKLLDKSKNIVNYNPGEIIVKQGASMTHLLFIYSGLAKIYLEGINGHNLILELIKECDFVIGPGVHTDFKHHYSIAALTRTTVCFIDIHTYLDIMNRNQVFANENHRSENIKKINALQKFVSLTQKQMHGRMADALLYLHDDVYGTNPFRIDISRRDLADMTALSKESVIRILKQFKDDHIIEVKGSNIEILDIAAVRRYSDVG